MSLISNERTFKILLLGDVAVGKTSVVKRFVHGTFSKDYLMTIGMEPYTRHDTIDGMKINFSIWDIAAQEKFEQLRTFFYKGSKGALLVFDLTRTSTFDTLDEWIKDATQLSPDIIFILVGNKNDLIKQRQIKTKVGKKKAQEIKNCIGYIETSAFTGEMIEDAFHVLGKEILNRI